MESKCERLEKENQTMKATITRLELMMAEMSKKLQDKERDPFSPSSMITPHRIAGSFTETTKMSAIMDHKNSIGSPHFKVKSAQVSAPFMYTPCSQVVDTPDI